MECEFLFNLFFFFLGLAVGSFLNCAIYRLETGGSFLKGRSFCPHCSHVLGFWDLIPVLSFLFLRGRCRYCKKRISFQYPLVEISCAFLFLLVFNFQYSLFGFLIVPFLIFIFVYDLKHYLIPDQAVFPALLLALSWRVFLFWKFGIDFDFFLAFLPALFFLLLILFSKGRWMGTGDFFLASLMALILGWPDTLAAFFLAFFTGAIMGIGLILLGKKRLKSELPFGPFLVAGTLVSLFWGTEIINWYLNFIS